jgi:hypothetical protein
MGYAKYQNTLLYNVWINMRQRCNNTNSPAYHYYGGRGITICDRWKDYEIFAADVGPHPGKGLTFDRINNKGNYEPGNVRWATRKTQSRNRCCIKLDLTIANQIRTLHRNGVMQNLLAKRFGVSPHGINQIVHGKRWV